MVGCFSSCAPQIAYGFLDCGIYEHVSRAYAAPAAGPSTWSPLSAAVENRVILAV